MLSSISRPNVDGFWVTIQPFWALNIPQNRRIIHISQGWGLWSGWPCKVRCLRVRSSKNARSLKFLCFIARPDMRGFKVMISYFKETYEGFPASYRDLKSMHIWQRESLGTVDRVVRDTLALHLKCNRRDRCEKSQNSKGPKKFLLDILAKSRWILAYDTAFERSQYPPK